MSKIAHSLLTSAALSCLFASAGNALAHEESGRQVIKPREAVTVAAGAVQGVGYFLNDKGQCRIVITLPESSPFGTEDDFGASRFETTLGPGSSRTFEHNTSALNFRCEQGANSMTIDTNGHVAAK